MSLTIEQLERFVTELAADPVRWARHVRHAPGSRTYELIHDDEHVNAWLICWSDDADTGFHDHDESAAAIRVIDGQVREDRLRLAGDPQQRVIGPGRTFSVPPTAIHRVLHAGDRPAVTIHAYSPPLTRTGAYWVGAGGELQRASQSFEEELNDVAGAAR
jgi:mannose-6-phosphate isomerase-like protein (cupin superfamily)